MLVSIQYLRAFAAILVLLTHTSFKIEVHSDNSMSWFNIGLYGVDLFFIISGYIMCLTVSKKDVGFTKFMAARFIRILPLYWLLTTVALAIFLIAPSVVNSSGGNTSIWASYTLMPTGDKYLVNNGWTLSYEFFFYFVFSLFLVWKKQQNLLTTLAMIALPAAGLLLTSDSSYLNFLTSPLLLEFAMGIFCYELIKKDVISKKVAIALVLASVAFLVWMNGFKEEDITVNRAVYAGLPMMILFLGFVSLESVMPKLKALYEMGMASYSLYLLHPFVLSAVTIGMKMLGLTELSFVYLSVMIVGSCLASWLCYHYVELTLDSALKTLLRSKKSKPVETRV